MDQPEIPEIKAPEPAGPVAWAVPRRNAPTYLLMGGLASILFVISQGRDILPWLWAVLCCVYLAQGPAVSTRAAQMCAAVFGTWLMCAAIFVTPWLMIGSRPNELFCDLTLFSMFALVLGRGANWRLGCVTMVATACLAMTVAILSWIVNAASVAAAAVTWTTTMCALASALALIGTTANSWSLPALFHRYRMGPQTRSLSPAVSQALIAQGAVVVQDGNSDSRQLGLDPQRSLPVLIAALAGQDRDARYSTAEALGHLGPSGKPAIGALKRLVGGDPLPGDRAAEALARMGDEGVAALIDVLRCESSTARSAAAAALGMTVGDLTPAIPSLVEALRDRHASVRQNAATSLGEAAQLPAEACAALREAEADPVSLVRLSAQKALQKLATR